MEFRILGPLEVLDERPARCRCRGRGSAACSRCSSFTQTRSSRRTGSSTSSGPTRIRSRDPRALQASVSRLRKALGIGSSSLATVRARLRRCASAPTSSTCIASSALVEQAADAEPAAAADELRDALALWRGPPLAEFAYEPFAQTAIGRLDELRLLALEKRIDADLALGRHADLVPELETLVSEHPLREGLRAQLMLALYRAAGRPRRSRRYQAARRTLVERARHRARLCAPGAGEGHPAPGSGRSTSSPTRPRALDSRRGLSTQQRSTGCWRLPSRLPRKPAREVIVARARRRPRRARSGYRRGRQHCASAWRTRGVTARSAVFTSASPGADVVAARDRAGRRPRARRRIGRAAR